MSIYLLLSEGSKSICEDKSVYWFVPSWAVLRQVPKVRRALAVFLPWNSSLQKGCERA